jgi:hypothetical protein
MGTSVAVDTPRARYARCAGCGEIKDLGPDGLLRDHNRYRVNGANGTSVEVALCPGSGRHPQDAEPQAV